MVEGLWIPIVFFISMTAVLSLFFWFRYRTRSDMQLTFRAAIDKGQELSAETIERLGRPRRAKDQDLRIALIWLAIAAALNVFGFAIPDDEAHRVMMGISSFPFFIGIAYGIMYRFTDRPS